MSKKTKGTLDEVKSEVAVSSVHTSDLSSFDDGISLSSADEIETTETDQRKKVPLKEVKEIAAVIIREKSISSGRSTPVMSSVEPENNKQESPIETEIKELQSEEERDKSKMWLRRERRVNPKYASEEYSSIFNEGSSASFEFDDNEEEIPSRIARGNSQEANTPQEKMKRRHSKDSDPPIKPKVPKISRRGQQYNEAATGRERNTAEQQTVRERRKTRSSSENQDASAHLAHAETSKKKPRSSNCSHTQDTGKQEHHRSSASSQRYDSSDLYKPRPIISSRRSRNSQEMQNTQKPETGRTTRQSSPLLRRRR